MHINFWIILLNNHLLLIKIGIADGEYLTAITSEIMPSGNLTDQDTSNQTYLWWVKTYLQQN